MSFTDEGGFLAALRDVRRLLHLAPERHVFQVVYGADSPRSDIETGASGTAGCQRAGVCVP